MDQRATARALGLNFAGDGASNRHSGEFRLGISLDVPRTQRSSGSRAGSVPSAQGRVCISGHRVQRRDGAVQRARGRPVPAGHVARWLMLRRLPFGMPGPEALWGTAGLLTKT